METSLYGPVKRFLEKLGFEVKQALACATALTEGPRRPRDLKTAMPDAPKILLSNVYGWFVRVERGLYGLTDLGRSALTRWPNGD